MAGDDSSESPPEAMDVDQEDGNDPNDPNAPPAKRQKRSRACQACRGMKIRCLPVEGQEACKACAKVNRACIMPGPARKRQKTVHKVAELEKKIDALTASLVAKNNAATTTAPTPPTDSPATTSTPSNRIGAPPRLDKEYSYEAVMEQHYPSMPNGTKTKPTYLDLETVNDEYEDVIAKGVIDDTTATNIYNYWKTSMVPNCPLAAYPDSVDVSWLRKNRPMSLLAIIVVASGMIVPDLQPDLAVEMSRQLADRVMFYNEKSIDLIHAMIIYTAWYGKHKFAKDMGFNHYIHAAVAMSLDLGLGKRSREKTLSDPQDAEVRRTWMACYYMSCNVATVLRLPPIVKFSPYLEECIETMKNHPAALPSDASLCCFVRICNMAQDVALLFHMDDPASNIPLNDSRTQYHLKLFERQLADWVTASRPYLPKSALQQTEACMNLYIHEIALHNEHNVDDFRPMYRGPGSESSDTPRDFLTNAHFEGLTACVDAMQRAMHAFLDMSTGTLRGSPALSVVWIAYVSVAMIRLHGVLAVPDSKYGSIFLPKLNIGTYLDACIHKLSVVTTGAQHAPAETFLIAFKKLKLWHMHRTGQQPVNTITDIPNTVVKDNKDYAKANSAQHFCDPALTNPNPISPRSMDSSSNQQGSPPVQQQHRLSLSSTNHYQQQEPPRPQQQQQYQDLNNLYPSNQQQQQQQQQSQNQLPPTPYGANSTLLDPANIDASTFDVQNWDFNVGELDNFETYLGDAGWMGYLM